MIAMLGYRGYFGMTSVDRSTMLTPVPSGPGARSRPARRCRRWRQRPSAFLALTGLSGCGKTTLLRLLLGLERPDTGRVLVDGTAVTGCGTDRSMVFQNAQLFPWRTALENVEFCLDAQGVPKEERRRTVLAKFELVGRAYAADRRSDRLSGDMQQRVGLARALRVDPEVLLTDEPFGALDAQTREGLQAEVLRTHQETGKTIVFVTHDLDEAVLLADRAGARTGGRRAGLLGVGSVHLRARHCQWSPLCSVAYRRRGARFAGTTIGGFVVLR